MSRKAREKSQSGTYHVLVTGIDRKKLFLDDGDKEKYVSLLTEYAGVCGYNLYAYCLMENHIHLLLNEKDGDISRIMKRLGTSYVYWFNNKYERTGPLFEDRFKSEAVETEEAFRVTLRYIHLNPVKEHLVDAPEEYRWSSYAGYFNAEAISSDTARRVFGETVVFKKYHAEPCVDKCLDLARKEKKLTDEALAALIEKEYRIAPEQLVNASQEEKLKILVQLMKSYNIPVRQLGRVTGISLTTIWRLTTKALVTEE